MGKWYMLGGLILILAAGGAWYYSQRTSSMNTNEPAGETDTFGTTTDAMNVGTITGNENPTATATSGNPHVVFSTSVGDIELELFANKAPKTVENFLKLTRQGFYNGTRFHRVIANFMIQGGDPLSKDDSARQRWGTGGPGYQFEDEFNEVKLARGVLAMANAGPNTNGSQFFIVTAEATPWLDGHHTPFGRVVSGMDVVMNIGAVPTIPGVDRPVSDVFLKEVVIK